MQSVQRPVFEIWSWYEAAVVKKNTIKAQQKKTLLPKSLSLD
jgi:hypothetical protein